MIDSSSTDASATAQAGGTSPSGEIRPDGVPPDGDTARLGRRRGPRTPVVVGALTAVVAIPLLVALGALHSPRWYPLLDLAMTELRVRDVGTSHTPMVGLVGRLSSNGNQGSHPGPISFWALAPVYRVLGGSAWSLFVGVVLLNVTAVALTLWIAMRRGGAALALAFAAAIAVLLHLYGTQVLTEPWNPYMPVMWWPLTLVAVWSVLCDDLPMLPVGVFAASFCMQTHISYLGLVGGFAALTLVWLAVRAHHLRDDRPARRRLLRWGAIGLGLGFVLWLPPLIDQITGDPGNASIVFDHFRHADDTPIGVSRGGELFGVSLNPWRYFSGQPAISGSVVPALVLVAAWAAAAVATWRLPASGEASGDAGAVAGADDGTATGSNGEGSFKGGTVGGARRLDDRSTLLRLHAVVAVALVLGLTSAARILGFVWFYLALWAWTITMLTLVATAWTVVLVAGRSLARPASRGLVVRCGAGALAGVLVVWTAMFTVDAADAEPTQANYSRMVGEFTEAFTTSVDEGSVAGGGADGRYLLTWTDGVNLGSTGYGLVTELERRGYDSGVIAAHGPGARPHRVLPSEEATAEVHISLGPDIEVWRDRPDYDEVVYVDLRTDEEVAEYERARVEAIEHLEALGRDELVEMVDDAPFQLYFDDSLPQETRDVVQVLADIGQPAALFIGPVTTGL